MGNQEIRVTHFSEIFASLRWPGGKPAKPPRYAYIAIQHVK